MCLELTSCHEALHANRMSLLGGIVVLLRGMVTIDLELIMACALNEMGKEFHGQFISFMGYF